MNMKKTSLKIAVIVPSLIVLIVGVVLVVLIVGITASSSTNTLTDELMDATVNEYTNKFESICNDGYAVVRSLAPIVDMLRLDVENPREEVVHLLRSVLNADANTLAVWTCWEPNAFDGRDSEYVNINEYHDNTGRFVPYLYRDGNTIGSEPLADYTDPVEGLYYQGAQKSGKPYITDPYPYSVGGKTINIYSIAIPILQNGAAIGVMGMDISLEEVANIMNSASILEDGYLAVLSPDGSIATHQNESMVLQSYKTTWLNNYSAEIDPILQSGGHFDIAAYSDVTNTNMEFITNGVMIGDTGRYWAVCGFIPTKTVHADSTRLVMMVIAIGLALIVIMGLTIFLLISKGLRKLPVLTELAGRISQGDINFDNLDTDTSPTRNEITLLERSFAAISNGIKSQVEVMSKIAGGDYSVNVPVRGEADLMNKAINNMLAKTNDTLHQITSATNQVSAGSSQIADGAQALAQGATEQASSIEELSASITEIADKTKTNATTATKAANLAHTIKSSAEKGSKQMDEMINAVDEINEASQQISKVIKTIDDIAFQTNILALNAAVEAARAGQHGKGFAVVAEEVRNLASKSAEAAKDTAVLIENSMGKAELGSQIASETAASLADIVSGINESSQLIAEIAASSEEQSSGITHINVGIDQVSQVVQQNSATAQESAAASEEMSGQSNMLDQLISQFKLKRN